jgi:hypothetical protein
MERNSVKDRISDMIPTGNKEIVEQINKKNYSSPSGP